ncbi:cytochrome P450 2J5-like [Elgaria multicarinata webbii]|uniref:cytochrome P450 2J5-like n=1 Tax=Elgaria multicarinata webbii TaxID=159646 RepID=UPI002FCCF339
MLGIQLFLIAVLVGLLILHFLRQLWSREKYPSGTLPLPVVGGMWRIAIRLYQDTLIKDTKQSGNTERPVTPLLKGATNEKDVIFSNGHIWKQQREVGRITMQKLEPGKKSIKRQIEEEAHQLVETFADVKGQPLDPLLLITTSVCNVVCAVAFGHRYPMEDKNFQKLIEAIDLALKYGGSFIYTLYKIFPWFMRRLPGPQKKALISRQLVISFAKNEIKKHKEFKPGQLPQDFIDFYLLQMVKQREGDRTSTYNEDNLAECILHLFISGTETTAITLQWALLLMATHPDIQDKVHKEMDAILGSSRFVCYQDRKKLSYTNAVIYEIQRAKYAFLSRIIRKFAKDVNIFGFLIPKGTFINPDLNSALLDPKLWEKPEKFNPCHFLDKDGEFVAREEFRLFGTGDCECLEEELARIELFVFFTNLLRAFIFQLPEKVKKIKKEPRVGMTTYPHSYTLCAIPRSRKS